MLQSTTANDRRRIVFYKDKYIFMTISIQNFNSTSPPHHGNYAFCLRLITERLLQDSSIHSSYIRPNTAKSPSPFQYKTTRRKKGTLLFIQKCVINVCNVNNLYLIINLKYLN